MDGGPWSDLARPPLRVEALRAALVAPAGPWSRVDVVAETGSTNADLVAVAHAAAWPDRSVLVTDHQVQGRGRRGRTWTAPPRAGIAVSVLLRPRVPPARWSWLPLLGGLAVVEALRRAAGVPAHLKWPNDVLVGPPGEGRKVCGVLAEAVADAGAVVLGAGLNVSQAADELPVPDATSLRLEGAATTDRDTVLRACLRELAAVLDRWEAAAGDAAAAGLADQVREACATLGQAVIVTRPAAAPLTGTAEGLDDDGRLLVRDAAGGLQPVTAGDVAGLRPAVASPRPGGSAR